MTLARNALTTMYVDTITLVGPGYAAKNGLSIIYKAEPTHSTEQGTPFKYLAKLVKADQEKHLIYAVVCQPDTPDSDGDIASADVIEAAAHRFLENGRQWAVNGVHKGEAISATVVESFILREADPLFPDAKIGAWCVVLHIRDVDMWDAVSRAPYRRLSRSCAGRRRGRGVRDPNPPS